MTRSIRLPLTQILLLGILLSSAALLTGCNTAAGLGQDVQAGGRAVERAAE
ncbi:entericidin A/B family lipoprotein [Azospirillum sp.]|uniref:entericidin A/B family lipoprotein n=1 Tax=Azospirillum sp. TaxID=34012 RepID=UPI003D74A56B